MKTLGIVGGIGWASSAEYYKLINLGVNQRLGGHHFAQMILYSVNFHHIHTNNQNGDWESTYQILSKGVRSLMAAGAEGILLGANTMHYLAEKLMAEFDIPLIHVATATGEVIKKSGIKKVALIGTAYTMELPFFKDKLAEMGIDAVIPGEDDRRYINKSIASELAIGRFLPETKATYLEICQRLVDEQGVDGIILGCTEIPLLINQGDIGIRLFPTTDIHVDAAVEFMVG